MMFLFKNEKIKNTAKRLRGRLKVTINESSYEKAIVEIKNANGDLASLREQIAALRDTPTPSKGQDLRLPTRTGLLFAMSAGHRKHYTMRSRIFCHVRNGATSDTW